MRRKLLDLKKKILLPTKTGETAFFLQPKGEKNVYSASGDDKENLMVTAEAAGQIAPLMVVELCVAQYS